MKTTAPWEHVGMICRTGDSMGHVFCVDGEEYVLTGNVVYEPVAPELAQLPPRKPIRAKKRIRVATTVPVIENAFLAECVAEEELDERLDSAAVRPRLAHISD